MADISLNPVVPVVGGALVSSTNPLPVKVINGTYTWATKPASPQTGITYFFSDVGTKGSFWYYDGTRWKPLNNQCLLASLDASVTGLNNSEVISFQYQSPVGLFQLKDRLRLMVTMAKSGATDTGILRWRFGSAGTTADSALVSATTMAASARYAGFIYDARIETATQTQTLGRADLGYGGTSTSAQPGVITNGNISGALFSSLGALSNSTNDTISLVDAQLWLIAPAN